MITRRPKLKLISWAYFLTAAILGAAGCGGGGGSSQTPPPPMKDFSLAVNPDTQTVAGGTTVYASLSAAGINGFSSQISVQPTGLPSGISVAPSAITLYPGTPQQISISAAANVVAGAQTATLTGTYTSLTGTTLTHTAQLSLSVTPFTGLPTRTQFLRTDATTLYGGWVNQHWIIYHAATGRYFVADPSTNQIVVVSAASKKKIGNILVPQAFGIDQSPDGSVLYVGTVIGDVYTVDPVGMTVIQRYMGSQIGPNGFYPYTALALADGQIALVGGQIYPSPPVGIEGAHSFAIWNPADNSITIYGGININQPMPLPCPDNGIPIGAFALSADRSKIIYGAPGVLCEFDPVAGTAVYQPPDVGLALGAVYHATITPDGNYVILANCLFQGNTTTVAEVFDAHTLALVSQFDVLGDSNGGSGFFVSQDSTTLYTPSQSIIYAYNLASQQLIGWTPNIIAEPDFVGEAEADGPFGNPYFSATDGTGLFVGPADEGLGFVDVSALQTGPVGTQYVDPTSLSPVTGPTTGGTATQWSNEVSLVPLTSVFFGAQPATSIASIEGINVNWTDFSATSPPGPAGSAADVYVFTSDGGMELLPEAFSYAPTILEVTPNMSTAEGGGVGYIYGYGFGPINATSVPTDLQVMVNGAPTQVIGFAPNAYNLAYPPFPLQTTVFLIPPGPAGSAVSVSVSTSAGSTTASGAVTYLPSTQQFPLSGSTLAQGIYDSYTGLYYFTDTNQIQVFSRTSGKWLSPISIPAPSGMTQRLWAIALSPDGTKLAISDVVANVIYVLSPSNPSSVKTFGIPPIDGIAANPTAVAISDTGIVYYAVSVVGLSGEWQFYQLDSNTGKITTYEIHGSGSPTDIYLRALISTDNSRVFFNDAGPVFYIDTATGTVVGSNNTLIDLIVAGDYDLALSSNQQQVESSGYFYDYNLNIDSFYSQNDREVLNIQYVYGGKLSPDGQLFFQPSTNGIDVFDAQLGNHLQRISLPTALSPNYDALVSDGVDNVLIAITGTGDGIAVVDLTSIQEPPATRSSKREIGIHQQKMQNHSLNKDSTAGRHIPSTSHTVPFVTHPVSQQHHLTEFQGAKVK